MPRPSFFAQLTTHPHATRWVLVAAMVLHFALGASVGFSVDEAHYALYATHLALSYFDHPPLVGWVQWPLVALNAPVAVLRWVPELLWLATAVVVCKVADALQALHTSIEARASSVPLTPLTPPRAHDAGFWSVLVLALAPLLHVLGIGLLPDSLLMFFTALLMWLTLQLMQPVALGFVRPATLVGAVAPQTHNHQPAIRWPLRWVALGVVLGLAGLSKYTAIFAALAVAWVLLAAHGLRLLRSPWPWAAVVVALVVVSPVGIWNAQNGWISFVYQTQHGKGGGWRGVALLQFLVIQVVAYGPLLAWGFVGWRSLQGHALRGLGVFFALPFGVLAALSGGGSSLPHWTAPAWVALAPLAGLGLSRGMDTARAGRKSVVRFGVGALAIVQLALCLALMGLMATGGAPWLTPAVPAAAAGLPAPAVISNALPRALPTQLPEPPNPFADVHGWEQAGARATELARERRLGSVAVQNWTLASRLGWYARPLPVHVLEDRFDQFDLWAGDLPQGGNTLLVDWSQMAYELPLAPHGFAQCTLLETLPVARWGYALSTFRFYDCRQWSGAPAPRLLGVPP